MFTFIEISTSFFLFRLLSSDPCLDNLSLFETKNTITTVVMPIGFCKVCKIRLPLLCCRIWECGSYSGNFFVFSRQNHKNQIFGYVSKFRSDLLTRLNLKSSKNSSLKRSSCINKIRTRTFLY